MRRRALLALVAGVVGGCLSAVQADGPDGSDATPELPPTGDGAPVDVDVGDPFERRTVGDAEAGASHRIVVWNDDADRRPIRVRLRAVGAAEPAVAATPTFPAYGTFRVAVFRPADYVLEIGGPDDSERRLGIRREFVDCDDSATHVAVRPDGSVRARVVSTVLPCDADPQPRVSGATATRRSR
ncbi:hypothetical protein [Halobellus ruber]|uniref:Uncharacterized protein n=1 Tax=Halobellus ruber TaxID=2761102 RepID=A0A7J9SIE6_9EURY|nr:hypothetical protein [Halobellus ruber]MBB6646272.1 hypothetical protein [Halobellus ruber]